MVFGFKTCFLDFVCPLDRDFTVFICTTSTDFFEFLPYTRDYFFLTRLSSNSNLPTVGGAWPYFLEDFDL